MMLNWRLWRRFRRALARQPFIGCGGVLLYHRVTELAHDPFEMAVSPDRFATQLAILRSRAVCLSLDEFLSRRAAGTLPRNAVALTFDDGYADNLHTALPLLERAGIPATIFVMSGMIGAGTEAWWDRLEQVTAAMPAIPDAIAIEPGRLRWSRPADVSDEVARADLRDRVAEALGWLDTPGREAVLERLWESLAHAPVLRASHRGLDHDELRRLAAHPLVTIGAHTRTHPHLARISADRQLEELADGRRDLEAWLDRPVTAIAYPHGSLDATTVRAAHAAGFETGFSSVGRIVPHRAHPLRINRMLVDDFDGPTFEKFLHINGIRPPRRRPAALESKGAKKPEPTA